MHNNNTFGRDIPKSKTIGDETFPTRSDYEEYCIEKGYASAPNDVWANDHAVMMIQRHWHHTGQNGCVFAQSIAYKQETLGWKSIVMRDTSTETIASIDSLIEESINNPQNEVVSLLFPDLNDAESVSLLVSRLTKLQNIQIAFQNVHGNLVSLGLRTPLAEGTVLSWLVAFAPLDYLPETRQSPVFELAIRTKLKGHNLFYRLNDSKDEVHLADVPMGYNDKTMERLWTATYNRTRKVLGGHQARKENPFASAKVTIALPIEFCDFLEK